MHAKRSPTHVKDPVVHVKFDGLWKHENNPANTKSVSFQNVEVGHYIEETLQINKAACSSVLRII